MTMFAKAMLFSLVFGVFSGAMVVSASASSFHSLVAEGYKPGGLTQSKAGNQGWMLKKGKDVFFCQMNVAQAYIGKDGLAVFTSAGHMYKISKKAYFDQLNISSDDSIPRLEDLKAGRPRPEDVGSCSPVR